MAELKTPIEKMPLTTRKNLREEWEAKKPGFESEMHDILGETWTIDVNPNLIYQYAPDDRKPQLGKVIMWYIEAFVKNLKKFQSSFGKDGIQELNSVCSKHQLTFAPQEKTKFSYGGLVIEDGVLRLVFAHTSLASNVDDVSSDFAGALKNAPAPAGGANAYNLIARNGVRDRYDPKVEAVRSAIATLVNVPDLKLIPNFEANSVEMAKVPKQKGWEPRIGWITLEYFEGLKKNLDRAGFKDNDMQQEAFQEEVTKGEVAFQIVPEWEDGKNRNNRVKVIDGVLYIQAKAENFDVNVDDAAAKILDIL